MFRPWEDPQPSTSQNQEDLNTTPVKKSRKQLGIQAQQIVLNVYKNIIASEGETGAVEKTSYLTKVPLSTIYRILKKGVTERKVRFDAEKPKEIDTSHVKLLRDTIYDKYRKNEIPTIDSLLLELTASGRLQISCKNVMAMA